MKHIILRLRAGTTSAFHVVGLAFRLILESGYFALLRLFSFFCRVIRFSILIVPILFSLFLGVLTFAQSGVSDYTTDCLYKLNRDDKDLLRSKDNSQWYFDNHSKLVMVFVHGILSDKINAWCNVAKPLISYWPELIRSDPRLKDLPIFLARYYTSSSSDAYDLQDAAEELYRELRSFDSRKQIRSPLDKNILVFVAHSAGGNVVRQMIVNHESVFARFERIGIILYASPALGSKFADWLRPVIELSGHSFASQLMWNSGDLEKLHGAFKKLIELHRFPNMAGREVFESKYLGGIGALRIRMQIVPKASAGKYFGDPVRLPNTDHSSIVKPDNVDHTSHKFLVNFLYEEAFLE